MTLSSKFTSSPILASHHHRILSSNVSSLSSLNRRADKDVQMQSPCVGPGYALTNLPLCRGDRQEQSRRAQRNKFELMFTAWRERRFGGKLNTQCLPGLMRRAWLCPRTRVRQMKPRAGKNYAAEHIAVPFEHKRRRRPTNKNALGALPCAAVFGFPHGLHPWSKLTVATSSLLAAGWHFVENQIDLKPRFPDDKKYLLTNKPPR